MKYFIQPSPAQFGYQEKVSAEEAICKLTNEIQTNFKEGAESLTVFFDVSGAFNETWHSKIITSLIGKNCPLIYTQLFGSFLENRRVHFQDDIKTQRQLNRGVPQGSVLSPLLWNTFYNEIIDTIKTIEPKAIPILFADDLSITLKINDVKDRPRIQRKMNKIIKNIIDWSTKNLIRFNSTKTTAVLFSRKNKSLKYPRHEICLTMDKAKLNLQKSAKYLGITLDARLTWETHINDIVARAKKRFFMLNGAISNS